MPTVSDTSGQWKKRSVVSSFILKFDGGKPRVALLQRSGKVSTYLWDVYETRHSYTPIKQPLSNITSPIAAAWRKLSEETTLTSASLTPLRQGKSYTFCDALRRVWFEIDLGPSAGKALSDGLDVLVHNHESGARQLAGGALQTLREVVAQLDIGTMEEWWEKVRFAAWHLWKNGPGGRESMGTAIMSVLLTALAGIKQAIQKNQQMGSWRDAALGVLDALIAARQASAELIPQAFATSGFVLDLGILESHPLYEGVSLAISLTEDLTTGSSSPSATLAHNITLSNASAALAVSGIDLVVLGADRSTAFGGSEQQNGLPALPKVVLLGESDKIAPPDGPRTTSSRTMTRLRSAGLGKPSTMAGGIRSATTTMVQNARTASGRGNLRMEIRNVFFEWVLANLVDAYITESGE
ncbi:Methylthioribose-1-phosphate isomerase [Chaetomidium leptoderma]|uniref:Methylthioribose-1-phosphate isomerase n=1 Tax=Chaetomidium leptoderma TaxID=669021 RepID=A0AAN6VFB7_9PEZI|nr:Methylthioribose-1-phosphate isomerase [Chaetomidium leptoderma]